MASTVNLKASGLNFSPNNLDLPEGSLIEASNVIIRRDNVIESRRGFKLFGTELPLPEDRVKQLATYKNRILRWYNDKIQFQNGVNNAGEVVFTDFNGSYNDAQSGLRAKSVESNGNFYFTSLDGIKKISAKTADELTDTAGYITNAGGIKALDIISSVVITPNDVTSWFTQDSAVAYRAVWATKDANNVLILGTPSQRSELYNPMLTLLIKDYMRMLQVLDSISSTYFFNDKNYVQTLGLGLSASASDLRTNLIDLVTKIDGDIIYADASGTTGPLNISQVSVSSNICTVTFSSGNPINYLMIGSKIELKGFGGSATPVNNTFVITSLTSTTIVFTLTTSNFTENTEGNFGSITSNEYRSITLPVTPSIPTTHNDLVSIQTYIDAIISQLGQEPTTVISSGNQTEFVDTLGTTLACSSRLDITIPQGINSTHFLQLYRSVVTESLGGTSLSVDVFPNDELQLVYEAYPTDAEILAGNMVIYDVVPDDFRGANLYTNPSSGEGILQSNDVPPFALDINRFKGYNFFANTKTRHRLNFQLVGVTNMVADYDNSIFPKITISDSINTNTYSLVVGRSQVAEITTDTFANTTDSGYIKLYSGNDSHKFYIWADKTGSSTDPLPSGFSASEGIRVILTGLTTAAQIAQKYADTIFAFSPENFTTTVLTGPDRVSITNYDYGYCTSPSVHSMGGAWASTVTTTGRGERASTKEVLLSNLVSPAQAVDETARSLVRVINANSNSDISAFYLSSVNDVPGKILLEGESLSTGTFYIMGNNATVGASFSPDIYDSSAKQITSISVANPTVITSTSHGLVNLSYVMISDSNSTPSIDGVYQITKINSNTFSIPVNVTSSGTSAVFIPLTNVNGSENEEKKNRIYYSKFQQPESVPIVNYFDVGGETDSILRIFPLRDSLFVFKESGVYRVSGETTPFSVSLFDSSVNCNAPDTVSVSNNMIYVMTNQGLTSVTESGAEILSRNIDTEFIRIFTSDYTSFVSATWGVGYESDNSYLLFTVKQASDTYATICYRYSPVTRSWTTYNKSNTCGIVNIPDDRLYLACTDINQIEQERKQYNRYDYADREYSDYIDINSVTSNTIKFYVVSNYAKGDVIAQTQTVVPFEFNTTLRKLDSDPGVTDTDYLSTLSIVAGDNIRDKLYSLAQKLDADVGVAQTNFASTIDNKTGTITDISAENPTKITSVGHGLFTGRMVILNSTNSVPSIDGTYPVTVIDADTFTIDASVITPGTTGVFTTVDDNFTDVQVCYNKVVDMLNNDANVYFSNYKLSSSSVTIESTITNVNPVTKVLTLNTSNLTFLIGDVKIYKAIESTFTYAPNHMGDPLGLKQCREATMMFQNKAFTTAKVSFASDLLPSFSEVEFNGDGKGLMGTSNFGGGFFGGNSNSAPFRTYIPRDKQRCRYILVKFTHKIAREQYAIFGTTLTGEVGQSSRAYR
jgi:hypothetical protein